MGVRAGLYMCDFVKKSSRSLSHLLMSSCFNFGKFVKIREFFAEVTNSRSMGQEHARSWDFSMKNKMDGNDDQYIVEFISDVGYY